MRRTDPHHSFKCLLGRVGVVLCLAVLGLTLPGCPNIAPPNQSGQDVPAVITSSLNVSPARGPVLGGTKVTVRGVDTADFDDGTVVLFGAFLATDIEVVDPTTVKATAPAQAAGDVDVIVRVASGSTVTRSAAFEYVAVKDADAEIIAQIEEMFPGPPHVVSAIATSNTGVLVAFSEPVSANAANQSRYSIVIPEGGMLMLDRDREVVLTDSQTVAELPTLSQSDAFYRLTVSGIHDLAGHPIAPPDMLVNPTEASFTGIAPANLDEHIDSDGDGFADWFEMLGWEITIELADGTRIQGYVTSDPYNPDTDGDGLTDSEENARSLDPRTDDTDADLVPDIEEVYDWRSDPCDQDSDDDGFADQTELHFGTSLILADTDGDQLDDRDELLNRNRNPLIADLPIPVITIGELNLELDERYSYTDQFGEEHQIDESFSSSLQRDTSSTISDTHSDVYKAHVEAKAGIEQGWGKDAGGKVSGEIAAGFAYERTNAWGTETSTATSRVYNEAINRVSAVSSVSEISRETLAARISAAVTLGAGSDIAFSMSDVELSILMQDPRDRTRLIPIGTLVPSQNEATYNVGPLVPEIGPLVFQNSDVFPNLVEDLMKDPRGLVVKAANYNITDEFGRNFAFTSQEVTERTAAVTIDYGNGYSEVNRIATAGRFDAQARNLGISMADAMRAIELLPWEGEDPTLGSVDNPADSRPKPTDADILASFGMRTIDGPGDAGSPATVRVITRVRGVQDDFNLAAIEPNKPNDGAFWAVFVSSPTGQDVNPDNPIVQLTANFDEIRLRSGEAYVFAFVKDKDRDQLTSLEEFFAGCNDDMADSDRDDLGDFLEIRGQWNRDGLGAWLVYTDRLPGGYRAYAAPYLGDSDEDGLEDGEEYSLCRYGYANDGMPLPTAFTVGTYDDALTNPDDNDITWDNGVLPADLPDAFPPSDGLPTDWHLQLDAGTGMPLQFPNNRASLDPRKADTDEDGISDADEVNGYYVDLFDDDPTDGIRTRVFVFTDPLDTDTDNDGLLDGMERQFGTNPASTDSGTVFDDDLDGLPNRVEETGWLTTINGLERLVFSNPNDPDSDNDLIPDYVEWVLGTSPWYYDPQVVLPDQAAPGYDSDEDGLSDYEEWDGTVSPEKHDKLAFCDIVPNCNGYQASSAAIATNPVIADTDGDGLNDGPELDGWLVNLDGSPSGYPVFSDPLDDDTEDDGWPDGSEFNAGTDPRLADTDGDGTVDPVEYSRGRNPLVPDQRVTIRYVEMCVGADGLPGWHTGIFWFRFGAWRLSQTWPDRWLFSEDMADWYSHCPAANYCGCEECGVAVRFCENYCRTLIYWGERAYVMEVGENFWLEGYLEMADACDEIGYGGLIPEFSWSPGIEATPYLIPMVSQSFTLTTGAAFTDDGHPIDVTITGFIEVD